MAVFVHDTFTLGSGETAGENLTAHVGEVGASWSALGGHGDAVLSSAGRVRLGNTTPDYWSVGYWAAGVPPSADYTVQGDLSIQSVPSAEYSLVVQGRWSGGNLYSFGYDSTLGWYLQKNIGGVYTTLATSAVTLGAGATHTIALVLSGNQLWGTVDGTTVCGPVTDTAISAAGVVGFQSYVDQTAGFTAGEALGPQLDNFTATDTSTATLVATPNALVVGSGPQSVQLAGGGTHFSTTSSTQFTLSGGTGASLVSQSASSATAAALVINPGTASGPLTITDTTDGSITATVHVYGTYYVSPSGSDSNTGLDAAHPWQTISHVNARTLYPGDTILFQGGQTHSGNLVVQNSGTAPLPIVIGAYGAGDATINPGTTTGIQVKDADYVRLSHLVVQGPGVTLSGTTSSTTHTTFGIEVVSTHTQTTLSTWRQSIYLDALTVRGCRGGIFCRSYGGLAAGSPYPVGFNDLRITNCTVQQCLTYGIFVYSTNATIGDYINMYSSAGAFFHNNVYIGNCIVTDIYADSSVTSMTGCCIYVSNVATGTTERCLTTNCGQACVSTGWGGGPTANIVIMSSDYTIQYCEASYCHSGNNEDAIGFDIDGGCVNCIIQYCYSHDNDGSGFLCYSTTSTPSLTVSNATFRYNIAQNNGLQRDGAGFRYSDSGLSGLLVHNNVFYQGVATPHGYLIDRAVGGFYNNIFYCGPGLNLLYNTSSATFAGNLYWFGGGAFSLVYGGTTYASLAAWRAVQETAGGVPSGVFADPQLAAAGTGGAVLPGNPVATLAAYALRAGSPAIGAGLDLRTLFGVDPGPIDFAGHPNRVGATYDVGACAYGAGALVGAGGAGGVRRVSLSGGIGG